MVKRCSFFNLIFVIIVVCVFGFFQGMAIKCHAGMHRLSQIQDGIFHLRPKTIRSDTDKTDRYIDDEQADQIAALSHVDPYTPADEDYPFFLVDSLLLDTDLIVDYGNNSCCLFCAGVRHRYLSRNDTSFYLFSGKKTPEVFSTTIHITEPFSSENVDALATTVKDHRAYADRHHTVGPTWPYYRDSQENKSYTGEMEGAYVHVIRACYTVWQHSHPPLAGTCFKYTPDDD